MSKNQKYREKLAREKAHLKRLEDSRLQKLRSEIEKIAPRRKVPESDYKPKPIFTRDIPVYPSLPVNVYRKSESEKIDYDEDPEMKERELAAQKEIERRKLCLAPAYNKGAYQPVFSVEDAKHIGRK